MNLLADMLARITRGGTVLGGIFLIGAMLLLMSNILGRFVHYVIPGSYELFELIMVIPIAVALVCAVLHGSHVVVNLIVSRFPKRLAALSEVLANLLCFVTWGFIAFAGAHIAYENGWEEATDILKIHYLPFRIVWVTCLVLFSLAYLVDFYKALRRFLDK